MRTFLKRLLSVILCVSVMIPSANISVFGAALQDKEDAMFQLGDLALDNVDDAELHGEAPVDIDEILPLLNDEAANNVKNFDILQSADWAFPGVNPSSDAVSGSALQVVSANPNDAVLVMTETFSAMPEAGSAGSGKWAYQGANNNRSITADSALQLVGDTSTTAPYARYEIPTANQKSLMTASFRVRVDSLSKTTKKVSFGFMSNGTSAVNEIHKLVLSDPSGLYQYRSASGTAQNLASAENGSVTLIQGQWYDFTLIAATKADALGDRSEKCDVYMGDTLVYTGTMDSTADANDVFRSFFIKIDSASSPDLKVSIDDLSIYEGVKIPDGKGNGGDEPVPPQVLGAATLVEIDKPIAVLFVGNTATIIPRVTYNAQAQEAGRAKYDTDVTYTSNNENVATVDQNGLVRAVGAGFAAITVASSLTPDIYEVYKVYVDWMSPGKATLMDGSRAFDFYSDPADWAEKSNWKVQLPLVNYNESGIAIGVMEKSAQQLQEGYQSDYFYLDENGWLAFWSSVEGGKTANTSYARSELREMLDPAKTSVNWGWEGTHIMEVTQKVEKVPIKATNATSVKYGETIITQIHGIAKDGSNANPLIKVRYQYNYTTNKGNLVIELKVGTDKNAGDDKPIFEDLPLNQEFTTVIKVIDNVLYCTIITDDKPGNSKNPAGGYREQTFVHKFVDMDYRWSELLGYYKAGNYIQDNAVDNHFAEPTHGEGALVKIKPGSLKVYHSDDVEKIAITGLTLEQTAASVALGDSVKLAVKYTPEDTTEKALTWAVTSGGENIVVSQDGTVLGLKEGNAVVTVTSAANPSLYSACNITVVGGMPVSNGIPIYETNFEDDTLGATESDIPNWYLSPAVTDGSATLEDINGNKAIRIYDYTSTSGLGALLQFPEQNDTMTIQFSAMMDEIYSNAPADRANGAVSKMYIGVGVSSDGKTLNDASQTYRIRDNGANLSAGIANGLYWQPTNNGVSGYSTAQENADKAYFGLGEWKEITYIVTPDNNSPYKNTTKLYIDGYYIGTYQNHVGAGKSDFAKLSHFRFYTGTADAMTAWIDDVKVYSGAMTPSPKNSDPIETFEIAAAPSKIFIGDTFQLTSNITPANAIQDVEFRITNGTAASVSQKGLVIGLSEGTVTIEMVSKAEPDKKAFCTIEVVGSMVYVTKIALPLKSIDIKLGQKYKLNPIFTPSDATEKSLSYTILSGSDIISVSSDGEITGLKPGVASIKLTSLNNPRATIDCSVSVTRSLGSNSTLLYRDSFSESSETDLNRDPSKLPYWGFNLDGNTIKDTSVTVQNISEDNYALKFVDGNPGGQPTAMLKFEPISASTTFNFKMMIENDKRDAGNNVSAARVSVGSGAIGSTEAQTFVLKSTGTFSGEIIEDRRYQYLSVADEDGTVEYRNLVGSSYQLNAWNNIKLVVTPNNKSAKANTTDIYVNGTKLASVNNLLQQSVVDGIQFHSENQSLITYWIDDVEVWAGEYLADIYPEEDEGSVSGGSDNSGSSGSSGDSGDSGSSSDSGSYFWPVGGIPLTPTPAQEPVSLVKTAAEIGKTVEDAVSKGKEIVIRLEANESLNVSPATVDQIIKNRNPLIIEKQNVKVKIPASNFSAIMEAEGNVTTNSEMNISVKSVKDAAQLEKTTENQSASNRNGVVLPDTVVDVTITHNNKKITSHPQPIELIIDLSKENLTSNEIDSLSGARFNDDKSRNLLGGAYDSKTKTFSFYTSRLSLYGLVKNANLMTIKMRVESSRYSVNKDMKTSDVAPTLVSSRTMIPVRVITEALGAKVEWNAETKTAKITLDGKTASITIGELVSGMDVAPVIINDRILVPIRYIAEAFDSNVLWDAKSNEVTVYR